MFHYSARTIRLKEGVGASGLHIPVYSPQFNTNEEFVSKIDEFLRMAKDRTNKLRFGLVSTA